MALLRVFHRYRADIKLAGAQITAEACVYVYVCVCVRVRGGVGWGGVQWKVGSQKKTSDT